MLQLDLFEIRDAPPPPTPSMRQRRQVQTRAGLLTIYDEKWPDPFEMTIRGLPCVIAFSGGFCTHVIEPAGSPFWSETGFRSFGVPTAEPSEIEIIVERYIDGPAGLSGCGGNLRPWWPSYILQWQQCRAFELGFASRADVWAQWGEERHAECWANHDARQADALVRMVADGIDPNVVGKPSHFRGKWPAVVVPAGRAV